MYIGHAALGTKNVPRAVCPRYTGACRFRCGFGWGGVVAYKILETAQSPNFLFLTLGLELGLGLGLVNKIFSEGK